MAWIMRKILQASYPNKNAKKIINNEDNNLSKIAIMRSCKIKSKIVNKDERDKNLRMILNFGHTFAHGFEGAKNFSKKLNHGEAVLLGMMIASELRSEEHTSELQSRTNLVCRLLLEKKKQKKQ